jgi:hypothetical protein
LVCGQLEHEGTGLSLVAGGELAGGLTGHANLSWASSDCARQNGTTSNLRAECARHAAL